MDKVRLGFIGCGGRASLLQANIPQVEALDFVATCDLAATWRQGDLGRSYGRPGCLQELRHFAAALAAGEQPRSSLSDSLLNMGILEAIVESDASGAPVALAG